MSASSTKEERTNANPERTCSTPAILVPKRLRPRVPPALRPRRSHGSIPRSVSNPTEARMREEQRS